MNRDFIEMNERNGACLRLPASCSLSSYIVLFFEDCPREGGRRRGREKEESDPARWEDEDERRRSRREKPARRFGFGPGCSGVALPCGDHKGSRRILILVSPNLLTYLTYPEELTEDSSGTLGQLNPKFSLPRDNLQFSYLPLSFLLSFFTVSPPLSLRSPFSLLPLLPVFSGAALR